jgi:hypothetical protein
MNAFVSLCWNTLSDNNEESSLEHRFSLQSPLITSVKNDLRHEMTYDYTSTAIINLWVATQNFVAGNIPMGCEYIITITLFFILDEP